jgi:hypothetical protein
VLEREQKEETMNEDKTIAVDDARIDAEYVELPVDMYGKTIRIGDAVCVGTEPYGKVDGLLLKEHGWKVCVGLTALPPYGLAHDHCDSFERIAAEIEESDVDGCTDWADRIRKLAKEEG